MAEERGRRVSAEMVAQLARLAGIELDAERRALIADQLDGLLSEANLVNRFMAERRDVGPGVRFDHPELRQDDE